MSYLKEKYLYKLLKTWKSLFILLNIVIQNILKKSNKSKNIDGLNNKENVAIKVNKVKKAAMKLKKRFCSCFFCFHL